MISLISPGTAADTTGLYNLLAIIADPEAAKQRLDEIAKEKHEANAVLAETQAAKAALIEDRKAAVATLVAAGKTRTELARTSSENASKLASREAALKESQTRLDNAAAAIASREKAVADTEAKLKQREDGISAREAEAKKLMDAAQSLKADYDQKVSALKAAVA